MAYTPCNDHWRANVLIYGQWVWYEKPDVTPLSNKCRPRISAIFGGANNLTNNALQNRQDLSRLKAVTSHFMWPFFSCNSQIFYEIMSMLFTAPQVPLAPAISRKWRPLTTLNGEKKEDGLRLFCTSFSDASPTIQPLLKFPGASSLKRNPKIGPTLF